MLAKDFLVGPILRRVETDLISVFVALTQPAKVEVRVYHGLGSAASLIDSIPAKAATGDLDHHTLAIGKGLHVTVALWGPATAPGLIYGQIYSYDVIITPDSGGGSFNLNDLGLLADNAANPGWLALGYQAAFLPSFVMPPASPADLKIVQGSCRGSNGRGRDLLPSVDDQIRTVIGDPALRPQMLFLTGDQIYADENAPEQLDLIQTICGRLLGGDTPVLEQLPVDFKAEPKQPAEVVWFPLDIAHFPPGRRAHLTTSIAGFTSDHSDSHTLGFGEFCALYLMMWSNIVWTGWDPAALLKQRKDPFTNYLRSVGQKYQKLSDYKNANPSVDSGSLKDMIPYHDAWTLVPDRYRAIDSVLTPLDADIAWGKVDPDNPDASKGFSVDQDQFNLWAKFWTGNPDDTSTPSTAQGLTVPTSGDDPRTLNRLAKVLTPSWFAGVEYFGIPHHTTGKNVDSITQEVAAESDRVYDHISMLELFRQGLPRARRALANIPTYMIFDDHEITDDWNITPGWAKRTRSSNLARAILRNGLSAVTIFQMWGNDPRSYQDSTGVPRQVLGLISNLYNSDKPGRDDSLVQQLERLFDLIAPPSGTDHSGRMTWHFRYESPGLEVIGLDSRTWRGFEPQANPETQSKFADDSTATLLTDEALSFQVAPDPAIGVTPSPTTTPSTRPTGVCIVLAGAPVLGYPVVESAVQPMINLVDIALRSRNASPPFTRWKQAFLVGRVKHDPEPWGFLPSLFEALLARLASRRCVIFLSGDVHYSFTLQMCYWQLDPSYFVRAQTKFIQLTSSSFRQYEAPSPIAVADLIQQLGGASAEQLRWGWHRGPAGHPEHDAPITAGVNPFGPHLQLVLQEDPIVVSPGSVPAGTTYLRDPEWAWKTRIIADTRADEDRLATLNPPPFAKGNLIDVVQSIGERHYWNAQRGLPRNWHWWNNFTTVEFGLDAHSNEVVRHKVWSFDPLGQDPLAQAFIVAEVRLDVDDTVPRPDFGGGS